MVSADVQLKLNSLMQSAGIIALANPGDIELAIHGSIGEPAASLLLLALRADIPQSLLADPGSYGRLTQKLQDECFMAPEAADATVHAWATALGVNAGTLIVHSGPPLPHVEVIEPPSMRMLPEVVPTPSAVARRSSGTTIALIAVGALLVIAIGASYFVRRQSQDVAVLRPQVVSPPPASSSAVQVPALPGAVKPKLTMRKKLPPKLGDTSDSGPDADMTAYNAKLAQEHLLFEQAGEAFKEASDAIPATADINEQMDQAAPIWDAYSQTLAQIASDLEAMVPPADASGIHSKLAAFVRQFSALVEVGAQAARSHDGQAFEENGNQLKDLGTSAGQELNSAITAAGYDPDQYSRDGTLVKRK